MGLIPATEKTALRIAASLDANGGGQTSGTDADRLFPATEKTLLRIADRVDEISGGGALADNAGAHNGIYRGKYLGAEVTQAQYAAIDAGTFEDLYIGDYWTINNVNWRIAAFDYLLNTGDTGKECTTHHVVIVPDTCLYNAAMNNSDTTSGAYVGSKMYTTNLAQAKTIVNNAFGSAHVLNHREFLPNAVTNGYTSGSAWCNSSVDLMNEQMVYGCRAFSNVINGTAIPHVHTINKGQLPLFALAPSFICNRANWWLRDVVSASHFALVAGDGICDAINPSNYRIDVRPAFGICA